MQFNLDMPGNIIEIALSLLSWGLIIYFIFHLYQKQEVKPKIWKAIIATLVGIFSFNFDFPMFGTILQIPILPLGVWVLLWYASSRPGAWDKYGRYAWLGFKANFIFLGATLLTVFLHHAIYPKDELSTYIADYENASIIALHPSAKEEVQFHKERFAQQFDSIKEEPFDSIDWYNELTFIEPEDRKEQFPYQLFGTSSRWGSGIPTLIYVEKDGKGILIDSSENQRYFRSEEAFLKGGNDE
ncbi:MAG: hypothetical protein LRY73_09390 [Bacillus sp. (in: Bacteria)]|nr:hypothetical protein [Bacillus sp. (in: firmicutes)]